MDEMKRGGEVLGSVRGFVSCVVGSHRPCLGAMLAGESLAVSVSDCSYQ